MSPMRIAQYTTILVGVWLGSCTTTGLPPAVPEERTILNAMELQAELFPDPALSVPLTVVTAPELIQVRETEGRPPPYRTLRKQHRRRPPQVRMRPKPQPEIPPGPERLPAHFQYASLGTAQHQEPRPQRREGDLWDTMEARPRPGRKAEAPEKVIESLNHDSLVTPRREWSQGGIVHYPYEVGYTYLVHVAIDHPTVLFLPVGEELADALRVDKEKFDVIAQPHFGKAAGKGQRTQAIMIQGLGTMATATAPILTKSGLAWWVQFQEVAKTSMRGVTWRIPEDLRPLQEGMGQQATDVQPVPGIPSLNLERLHKSYTIEVTQGSPPWVPEAVLDDGQRTLIKFAESPAFGAVPAVFSVHANGEPAVVEWMPYEVPDDPDKAAYYVIGGIWPRLLLKGADGMTVTITRGLTRRALAHSQKGAQ